ncbi:MAG TPA: 4-hydroxy-tetrahydrodipicolinate reductase [Chitinophagaceae bacterium]|nr:4-hydroxy-tetrahydrodipicolinate reductase [Chitinophagaceae bacterium]
MKIALIGYGKMGRAIEEIAVKKGHEVSLVIDLDNAKDLTKENLQKADVAIEFTTPETAVVNILKCFDAGTPVVSGTTGWLHKMDEVKDTCLKKDGSFVYSSNFSIGVNIFFELNKRLAELMSKQDYEVIIEETHHTQKKDAPSGTAITIAEGILKELSNKKQWVNHKSDRTEDLSIISHRIDPAAGTHCIKYSSEVDDIDIIHTAHNRKGFASGAVLAAEFIKDKKGPFSMKDVLGI